MVRLDFYPWKRKKVSPVGASRAQRQIMPLCERARLYIYLYNNTGLSIQLRSYQIVFNTLIRQTPHELLM